MKKFPLSSLLIITLIMFISSVAFAGPVFTKALLTNQATSNTTAWFNTGFMTKKSVAFAGMSSSANVAAPLSGVATLQCKASATAPAVTCKDKAGIAVTTTNADAVFNLDDLFPYVRLVWTRTTQKITAYLLYSEP